MTLKGKCAIAGVGITEMGKVYGRSSAEFGAEAIDLALDNAGLTTADVDGLLINAGVSPGLDLSLQNMMGLRDLRLLNHMNAFGSTASAMVQFAAMAT